MFPAARWYCFYWNKSLVTILPFFLCEALLCYTANTYIYMCIYNTTKSIVFPQDDCFLEICCLKSCKPDTQVSLWIVGVNSENLCHGHHRLIPWNSFLHRVFCVEDWVKYCNSICPISLLFWSLHSSAQHTLTWKCPNLVFQEWDLGVLQQLNNVWFDNSALKFTWGLLLHSSIATANKMSLTESLASNSSRLERAGNLTDLARRKR